jgi:glycerol-3-phosphate dehydrogenase
MLRERGLTGAAFYADAQCDDARLVIATARSASQVGAQVANYMAARSLIMADGAVAGAQVEDTLTGERGRILASAVINAAGPWSDAVRR